MCLVPNTAMRATLQDMRVRRVNCVYNIQSVAMLKITKDGVSQNTPNVTVLWLKFVEESAPFVRNGKLGPTSPLCQSFANTLLLEIGKFAAKQIVMGWTGYIVYCQLYLYRATIARCETLHFPSTWPDGAVVWISISEIYNTFQRTIKLSCCFALNETASLLSPVFWLHRDERAIM